ncbi:hypothetical protein EYC98_06900 [Halieaceae bacterium IMCC14734]|uniref:DUF2834 domain-containing protein n=1 Tax=Candidatus Litorirhabdus singularis TaxID=2518993 RepID=A0ABT3TE70_9GAMM|nr:hypothetical protein [Candidatus Litorirhabdus singularis]MCX2980602.1 hypothetical protein [Candidatus Litorirhabdus singularis]
MTKFVLAGVWLLGWIHVLGFSPEGGESVADTIVGIMQNDKSVYDPMVFMVFNILGVWPIIMVAMLVQDTQGKLKAFPFAISSMILGNSALYIYLLLRKEQKPFAGRITPVIRFAESKILALVLLASTIALLVYGLSQGNFTAFMETWHSNIFVNVMTVDFFLFPIAFAFVLTDDMRRRNMSINGWFWLYALLPALGAVIYLTVRKPLPDNR